MNKDQLKQIITTIFNEAEAYFAHRPMIVMALNAAETVVVAILIDKIFNRVKAAGMGLAVAFAMFLAVGQPAAAADPTKTCPCSYCNCMYGQPCKCLPAFCQCDNCQTKDAPRPVGDLGPNYEWKRLPGIGWGWVQKGIKVTAPECKDGECCPFPASNPKCGPNGCHPSFPTYPPTYGVYASPCAGGSCYAGSSYAGGCSGGSCRPGFGPRGRLVGRWLVK